MLEPAEAPLKVALDPAEEDRLSGDMRELYDRLLPSAESEKRRAQLVEKLESLFNNEWPGYSIKVHVFGSSGNLLCSNDSDVDICITTPVKKLESMHMLAAVLAKHGMERVVCVASAKVPIVKMWDPTLTLACDMNVNNTLALENTRMIKTYVQIDERVRPLAMIIKYWTKRRILNDAAFGGTISSYTWMCMIINFLQTRKPPILPALQQMPTEMRSTVDGKQSAFADDLDRLRGFGVNNTESLGQLLLQFFRYYGHEMNFLEFVISVRQGRLLSREEKGWTINNMSDKEGRHPLCVEEPFNTSRNLGNSADGYAFRGIHLETRRAFDMLADHGQLADCCEQYVFPPEERATFERPRPKPRPVITRSASQSGRGGSAGGGGRGHANGRGGRNNTNHRNAQNSRRSSSAASYGMPQHPFPQSPPAGGTRSDYFGRGNLHDQLYQQYQILHTYETALRTQLVAQAQQAQVHGVDPIRSPQQFLNGHPSPRQDHSPANGTLYHYPVPYSQSPLISQSFPRDGTSTSPSSPCLAAAVPTLRRAQHRSSITNGSPSTSVRSHSQPGRSVPSPLALQTLAQPGYDVTAMNGYHYLGGRTAQFQHHVPAIADDHFGLIYSMSPENAMPKEYVGYGVTPVPLQAQAANLPQIPPYRDLPFRMRRVSPDLVPISMLPNGLRRLSRSPSPLGCHRTYSTGLRSAPLPATSFQRSASSSRPIDDDGPLIVNGSFPQIGLRAPDPPSVMRGSFSTTGSEEYDYDPFPPVPIPQRHDMFRVNSADSVPQHAHAQAHDLRHRRAAAEASMDAPERHGTRANDSIYNARGREVRPVQDMPEWQRTETSSPVAPTEADQASQLFASPRSLSRNAPRLSLASKEGSPRGLLNGSSAAPEEVSPGATAPLLSPVFEAGTPSPKANRGFEGAKAWQSNGTPAAANGKVIHEMQAFAIETQAPANTKSEVDKENHRGSQLKRDSAAPVSKPIKSSTNSSKQPNAWQPAGKKNNHKRSKQSAEQSSPQVTKGKEPLPLNEAERKGG
ncbi:hypothetical protein LTR04_005938 [Oleoguttula sp. CCFEE 6159]|nr:hypothetical protein LTR04_005938 [Oleoguttula sp. CCFEE 6159]